MQPQSITYAPCAILREAFRVQQKQSFSGGSCTIAFCSSNIFSCKIQLLITGECRQVGRSRVDTASFSDARGAGFKPWPLRLKKYHFFTPKPKGSPRSRAHPRNSELSVRGRGLAEKQSTGECSFKTKMRYCNSLTDVRSQNLPKHRWYQLKHLLNW